MQALDVDYQFPTDLGNVGADPTSGTKIADKMVALNWP